MEVNEHEASSVSLTKSHHFHCWPQSVISSLSLKQHFHLLHQTQISPMYECFAVQQLNVFMNCEHWDLSHSPSPVFHLCPRLHRCLSGVSVLFPWRQFETGERKHNQREIHDQGGCRTKTQDSECRNRKFKPTKRFIRSSQQQKAKYFVLSHRICGVTTSINFLHVFIVRLSRSVGVSGNFPAWVGVVTGFTSGAELSVPYLYLIHDQPAEGFFRPALSSTYCQFGLLPMAATRPPWSLALCL